MIILNHIHDYFYYLFFFIYVYLLEVNFWVFCSKWHNVSWIVSALGFCWHGKVVTRYFLEAATPCFQIMGTAWLISFYFVDEFLVFYIQLNAWDWDCKFVSRRFQFISISDWLFITYKLKYSNFKLF